MRQIELHTGNLGQELVKHIQQSSTIYILTAFLMESGVALLRDALYEAANRGAEIRVCTGDYLYITQPDALESLIGIHENIDVKLFKSYGVSFHPKAYIFDNESQGVLFVGSSNLSRSALQHGIEWNISMQKSAETQTFEDALEEFSKLYNHENTISINYETIKLYREVYDEKSQKPLYSWSTEEELDLMLPTKPIMQTIEIADFKKSYAISPRFAQIQALQQLETTRAEGFEKALVVMATGLGKTYLAAFFANHFHRVLFVAHREEILYQAQQSFQNVHANKTTGIFNGKIKERHTHFIFASISTLNQKRHLHTFSPEEFDLIVIDEFHHAAANSYKNVLEYFRPKFLLGITATPYRNDNRDIFSLCDGNLVYKIDFVEAIKENWLAPFHYYGVYDDTDYTKIRWVGTGYDQDQLQAAQNRIELYEKTLKAWRNYKQTRTLVFCSSVRQAEALHAFFQENGHRTIALHSNTVHITRKEAIRQLEIGEIEAIFTVDLFNEGIDIPSVDTLLFTRPTESLTVFTQQIGRGLRLHKEKKHCVIIDLIGNYRNAEIKMGLFQISDEKGKGNTKLAVTPDNCEINFDIESINLLSELEKKKMPRRELLIHNYTAVKTDLGRRPTYLEVYQNGTIPYEMYRQEFKSYIGFLHAVNELTPLETDAYEQHRTWLEEIERTSMVKSYKMVVLQAMLERGEEKWFLPITPEETAPFFHAYYMEKKYRQDRDFSNANTKSLWVYNESRISKLIADMPMSKLVTSNNSITFENNTLSLNLHIQPRHHKDIYVWTKEIVAYRLHYYFFHRSPKLL